MDDFKRFYSNNEETKSIPYFWEKFDKENYSIWYSEYKYQDELAKVYMSCNLITGKFEKKVSLFTLNYPFFKYVQDFYLEEGGGFKNRW